ncbi:MAG: GGDEF domain-containing protein [Planctomycetaceae bacterium]|nr:GGDEF domain-containing protein [Planctomycetaceae bacterium]
MISLVFVISALSAAVGYMAAVLFNHRQITAEREDNKLSHELERKELTEFMQYVQGIASNVDEKVDRHSLSLTAINHDIAQGLPTDPKVVLRAVKKLFEANVQLHGELTDAQVQIDTKQHQLESYMAEARTDTLTGVSNRRAFDEEIHRQFALRERRPTDLCLQMSDIDHFKLFNDYHGHQDGDDMLQRVAGTFELSTRSSDIVCRYGGEEFAILLPRTKLPDALRVAERARSAIEALRYDIGDIELHVTVSVGAVELRPEEGIADFVKRGDEALYSAKQAGRNYVWHQPSTAGQQLDQVMSTVAAPPVTSDAATVGAGG